MTRDGRLSIPWLGTALDIARDIKNSNWDQILIKCFHGYRLSYNGESLAFIFHSSMKSLQDSIVGTTVPHGVSNHNEGKSRATLCQAMDNIYRVSVADLFFFSTTEGTPRTILHAY